MQLSTVLCYAIPLFILGLIWTNSWSGNNLSAKVPAVKLHGNFLHITDLHPDPYYKTNATARTSCHVIKNHIGLTKKPSHMKRGNSGPWGAPATICDSPMSLINATFDWLEQNWADKLDFIIWTGDNARHDNDDRKPRKLKEILELNRMVADKFLKAFSATKRRHPRGKKNAPRLIPIVPSLGNNDVYPSNIIGDGPNHILDAYKDIWSAFIPKKEIDTFRKGGYFTTEVIPNELIVVSVNTLYFYDSNTAVKGCEHVNEPGTVEMKWLEKVLSKARKRGMKVYITGHVAPTKKHYTPSCWKSYVRLTHKYHDMILGHLYGHSNMDHFYFIHTRKSKKSLDETDSAYFDEEDIEESITNDLPIMPVAESLDVETNGDESQNIQTNENGTVNTNVYNIDHYILGLLKHYKSIPPLDRLAANDYSVIHVNPSVVPTFFPALRIYQYNTTFSTITNKMNPESNDFPWGSNGDDIEEIDDDDEEEEEEEEGKKKRKEPRVHDPNSSPHINTYLTPISYVQYFVNLTKANVNPHETPEYEIEYSTKEDYHMQDLTINSWLRFARKIAKDGLKGSLWKKFRAHLMVSSRDVVKQRKAQTECMYGGCTRVQGPEDFLAGLGGF